MGRQRTQGKDDLIRGDFLCFTIETLSLSVSLLRFGFLWLKMGDQNWATKIYQGRAQAIDADSNVAYFFLKHYQEICQYMRTIGYGSKGKAETREAGSARV
jgi:hypothetical protein